MSELSPQEHVDARVLAYYGSEFDEGDRLVGRSGQGVLEFERTRQIVGERVPAGAHIIDIGGASGLHAAAAWVTVIEPSIELATSGRATSRSPYPEKWRRLIGEGAGDLGHNGFPGGHFHLADDLEEEALAAGLRDVRVIGIEGPGAQAIEISRSHDPLLIAAARTLAEAFESQPGLRDLSPHLLAMGRTPGR